MKRNTPIYSQLLKHDRLDRSSFHTPGHKGSDFLPNDLWKLDYTELPDTDALYESDGIIRQTEENLSRLFQTKATYISGGGGCTLAIQAMIRLAQRLGNKMLFARNVHRSAVNTMKLLGIEPVWIMTHTNSSLFTGVVEPSEVETALTENPDIHAVYLTSPNYYGELCDIRSIADICHNHNAVLLVDNAHGSHLGFGRQNLHPIHLGADMTACSLHKTLPVLTGGAVLNINNPLFVEEGKEAMALFGSTSPSYPIMTSIDISCDYLLNQNGKQAYWDLEERVDKIKQRAMKKHLIMPTVPSDPIRVCINTSACGIVANEQERFFEGHDIDCEFCDGENAVFICTPFNTERDFQRLEKAIDDLPPVRPDFSDEPVGAMHIPETTMLPREVLFLPSNQIRLMDTASALGKIAVDSVCPCPPGIPVVLPGERVDEQSIANLQKYGIDKVKVLL